MTRSIQTLIEAIFVSLVFVSPVLASGVQTLGDAPGPLPTLGAGLPFLVVVGGAYLIARFLTRKRKQGV
jgi:hypothetical protein